MNLLRNDLSEEVDVFVRSAINVEKIKELLKNLMIYMISTLEKLTKEKARGNKMSRLWKCPNDGIQNDTVTCVKCGTVRPLLETREEPKLNVINEKALQPDGLKRLKGKKKDIPITGEIGRVRLEPDAIALKLRVEDGKLIFETSTGNQAPEVLKGIMQTLLLVLSKEEGLKELMGLARKLMR